MQKESKMWKIFVLELWVAFGNDFFDASFTGSEICKIGELKCYAYGMRRQAGKE